MKQANSAPNKIRKQFSYGAQHALRRTAFHTSRTFYFLSSILAFAVLTFLAHRQAPRPDPFQPVQTLSWDWWQYPLERNAFKRLPVITSNLNDVFALPNSEKVWAVGDEGMIVHSEDGGETWMQQKVNWEAVADSLLIQDSPEQEQQSDSTEAFGARQQNALRSNFAQKGVNPAPKQANAPVRTPAMKPVSTIKSPRRLSSVQFVDANHGWVVGDYGTILSTQDGGQNWITQKSGTFYGLLSLHFFDANIGWVAGDMGVILKTQNGGTTWERSANREIGGYIFSIYFVNADTGWAVGSRGNILETKDRGRSWDRRSDWDGRAYSSSGTLRSVYFANSKTGWAVDERFYNSSRGAIIATQDGGQTWKPVYVGEDSPGSPTSIHFVNSNMGWAVGSRGIILATQDGGQTWSTQMSGTPASLTSVHFINSSTGWAVGAHGIVLRTRNSGQSWEAQTKDASSWFGAVRFVNSKTGWIIGDNGLILKTQDGALSWQAQRSGTIALLNSMHFVNASTGWTVGFISAGRNSKGVILATQDGGNSWQLQKEEADVKFNSIHFVNASIGWAVGVGSYEPRIEGLGGIAFVTQDGGKSWRQLKDALASGLNSVFFVNNATGWVTSDDYIFMTQDSGQSWRRWSLFDGTQYGAIFFVNATNGWIVSWNIKGGFIITRDGGQNWEQRWISGTSKLQSIHFVDTNIGWAVGDGGTIIVTNDGGRNWQAQKSGATASLRSVNFVNSSTGWVVGDNGTILATTDGGQTWKDPTLPYSRSFAPWYYLSLLFIAPLLYLAFRKPKPIEAEQKTVADMLVSDRPIAAGDPDPLEFNAIARGLSRFLRNENTQPPLTIAITGVWGSGKSSLMNLLKADLERYGFRPVWFNAWHHQKEEHLLAALLENVRNQAIPRWWRLEGLSFRCHLLWLRAKRRRFVAALLLLLFAFAVGYVAVNPSEHITNIKTHVTNLEKDISDVVIALLPTKPTPNDTTKAQDSSSKSGADSSNNFSLLPFLLSAIASLVIVYRGLKAFGVNPVSLMASMSGQFKAGDLKAQMSFRYRFAQEFDEVTRALHPRTMLIFIDDLDRCQPKSVLEVLEAVNFLVSNGECYVVLGLDLNRVESYVTEGFKDVKEEGFARQYLQKLINIEVPVPQPNEQQSRNLIAPKARAHEPARSWWVAAFRKAPQFLPKLLPPVIVAATLIVGFLLGKSLFPDETKEPSTQTASASSAKIDSTATAVAQVDTTRTARRSDAETPERATDAGKFIPGQQAQPVLTWAFIALALIMLLGAWRLSIPSDVIVKDSPEFEEALRIWHPLIMAKHNTPRSVKRFVNRVRYFAMQQSAETEMQSVWQKLAVWVGIKQKEEARQAEAVPESILVALSAIHHFNAALFKREHFRQTPDGEFPLLSKLDAISPEEAVAMRNAMDEHRRNFGGWPPSDDDYEKLQKLATGIRIN